MEFRILGPVEVVDRGRAVALGPSKQRAVLALLVLHVNEVVSRDRLIEDLWGERAPRTAATSLHTYVSQLRKLLEVGSGDERQVLITRAPGYLLELDPEQVDLKRFEQLARRGKRELAADEAETAAATLVEALALWRGPPLQEFDSAPFALAESLRLQELRIATLEDRIEADLALGRHHDLVGELETLVAEHPFRERLHGQLMLALYRSGRQVEALEVYRNTRRQLVEELGIEPGPTLQELEQAILRHEWSIAPGSHTTGHPLEAPRPAAEPAAEPSPHDTSVPDQAPSRARSLVLRRRLVVAVAGVLVAITLGVGYAVRGHTAAGKRLTSDSVGLLDPSSGEITRTFPVGRQPDALTVADHAVWVANYRDGTVTGIDMTTGHSVTVPVGGHPTGIAAYRGTIWVWTLEGLLVPVRYGTAGHSLRLAPEGEIGREPGRITTGGGFLWITVPEATVLRVDPADPERRQSIVPEWGAEGPIVNRGEVVWVAGSSSAGDVFPIADRTGTTGSGIAVGGPIRDLAFNADSLYVLSGGPVLELPHPALRVVDLHDRLIRTTVTVGKDPVALAVAAGSIWVANESDKTISRVDPSQGRVVETIKLNVNPTGLAADRNEVWVAAG